MNIKMKYKQKLALQKNAWQQHANTIVENILILLNTLYFKLQIIVIQGKLKN